MVMEQDNKYRKRSFIVRNVDLINKHIADGRNAAVEQSTEAQITANNVERHINRKHHPKIPALLKKYQKICEGKVAKTEATTHHIDLIPEARPFKLASYRAGPKTRELEQF